MSKIKDGFGSGGTFVDAQKRGQIFGHLLDAKKVLPNMLHPAHGHINKAINSLGGIVSDSEADDLTSPGDRTYVDPQREGAAPSAAGASDISAKSAKEKKRDADVQELRKMAASTSDPVKKLRCETLAQKLAALDLSPSGGQRAHFVKTHGIGAE